MKYPSYYQEQIAKLREREKELKCLYKVQEIIEENLPVDEFLNAITKHIWGGWQYPNITRVKITFENRIYKEPGWIETEWKQDADIVIDEKILGKIEVFYTKFIKLVVDSQFLPEEQKLLNTIATKISTYIFNIRLKQTLEILDIEEKQEAEQEEEITKSSFSILPVQSDTHWKWRNEYVKKIVEKLDFEKLGVEAIYLIGSTKNANAGPASDIDLLVHFSGNANQETELKAWIDGWSLCLAEINLSKTGYKTEGLIDLHIITDKDIQNKNSFASMIGAISDGAKLIRRRTND